MNSFSLVKNPSHGFLQVHPTPTKQQIDEYYSKEFYNSGYPGINDSSLDVIESDQSYYEGHYDDIIDTVKTILKVASYSSIDLLDIGCGWAQALAYWQHLGVTCSGIDPAPEAVSHGQKLGINVCRAEIQNINAFDKKFNAITLMNVLEHLPDPELTISMIRADMIQNGGVLVVDVPNEFNQLQLAARDIHELDDWWVAPPAHLNYFDASSLTSLLEGNGFEVVSTESSFPMELFMLMGENYVKQPNLGKICHLKRVQFEQNMRLLGKTKVLRNLYSALASIGLGRQVMVFAKAV